MTEPPYQIFQGLRSERSTRPSFQAKEKETSSRGCAPFPLEWSGVEVPNTMCLGARGRKIGPGLAPACRSKCKPVKKASLGIDRSTGGTVDQERRNPRPPPRVSSTLKCVYELVCTICTVLWHKCRFIMKEECERPQISLFHRQSTVVCLNLGCPEIPPFYMDPFIYLYVPF